MLNEDFSLKKFDVLVRAGLLDTQTLYRYHRIFNKLNSGNEMLTLQERGLIIVLTMKLLDMIIDNQQMYAKTRQLARLEKQDESVENDNIKVDEPDSEKKPDFIKKSKLTQRIKVAHDKGKKKVAISFDPEMEKLNTPLEISGN